MKTRLVILVSGAPAAGKTTLATELATTLDLPLICNRPMGLGEVIEVNTTRPVDIGQLAAQLTGLVDLAKT